MAEVILTFEWDGKTVHKETKGFTGHDCISKTKFLDDDLGTPGDRIMKSEYYGNKQKESERTKIRN